MFAIELAFVLWDVEGVVAAELEGLTIEPGNEGVGGEVEGGEFFGVGFGNFCEVLGFLIPNLLEVEVDDFS